MLLFVIHRCLDLLDGHRLVSMEETPREDNKEPTQSRKRQRIDSQGDQARHAEVVVSGADCFLFWLLVPVLYQC